MNEFNSFNFRDTTLWGYCVICGFGGGPFMFTAELPEAEREDQCAFLNCCCFQSNVRKTEETRLRCVVIIHHFFLLL